MCSSRTASVAHIDGRPVLQPACNRIAPAAGEQKKLIKKPAPPPIFFPKDAFANNDSKLSPKRNPAMAVAQRRGNDPNGLNSSSEKPLTPRSPAAKRPMVAAAAGSIAAAQREQTSLMQQQRKMRIAHYGRAAAKLEGKVVPVDSASTVAGSAMSQEEKKCGFITPSSDPLYVAYHDEEWGVPVHDDKMLFELLVLSGFQVTMDWTTILKKRSGFREAFAGFDAEKLAKFSEKQISFIRSEYGMDPGRVRGVVDNAKRIVEVLKETGSLDKYFWGFVGYKQLAPNYQTHRKIPVKSSKSELISNELVRRGFRFVGPTVIHSFMQSAGLTNDHLLSCSRHRQILSLHSHY